MLQILFLYNWIFRIYFLMIFFFNIYVLIYFSYLPNIKEKKIKTYLIYFDKINKILENQDKLKEYLCHFYKNKNLTGKINLHKLELKEILKNNKNSKIYIKYKKIINNLLEKGIKKNYVNFILLEFLSIIDK